MRSFEMTGIAGLFLKYSGTLLDTVVSMDQNALCPPCRTYMRYSAGFTGLARGAKITGSVSAAIGSVNGVVITAGTLAGNDAEGIIFVNVLSGTFATGENLSNDVPTVLAIARTAVMTIPQAGANLEAKQIVVGCETNAIRILFDGSDPTNSAETGDVSYGWPVYPLDSYVIKGWTNVRNLKMINAISTANGVADLIISYGGAE